MLRKRRRTLGDTDQSQSAAELFKTTSLWPHAHHLALYLPNDGELDPTPIARFATQAGKSLYLPKIDGQTLRFAAWAPGQPLIENRYGIGEPASAPCDPEIIDTVLVPVVGFTERGTRLGMGGGFYDRFFEVRKSQSLTRIGVAYSFQEEPRIEALKQPWDQDLDYVLTESGLVCCYRSNEQATL
ncbi:MAG: 5-formyltetrahydrofolate cyclo-ligase [Congregibacter sp.]